MVFAGEVNGLRPIAGRKHPKPGFFEDCHHYLENQFIVVDDENCFRRISQKVRHDGSRDGQENTSKTPTLTGFSDNECSILQLYALGHSKADLNSSLTAVQGRLRSPQACLKSELDQRCNELRKDLPRSRSTTLGLLGVYSSVREANRFPNASSQ